MGDNDRPAETRLHLLHWSAKEFGGPVWESYWGCFPRRSFAGFAQIVRVEIRRETAWFSPVWHGYLLGGPKNEIAIVHYLGLLYSQHYWLDIPPMVFLARLPLSTPKMAASSADFDPLYSHPKISDSANGSSTVELLFTSN
jgi:hypothetical protein